MSQYIRNDIFAPLDPPPFGDGLFTYEPPSGNGLNITDLFHIVEPKPDDPDIDSAVDSQYPNVAIITHDRTNQFGGMWANDKLDLTKPFHTEIYLHLGHQYGIPGSVADGMTFTLHNDPAGNNAIGGAGEGLGVYKGRKWTGVAHYTTPHGTYLRNSLVIEFDTYKNTINEGAFVDDPGNPGTAHCALLIPRADIIHVVDHLNVFYFTPTQEWVPFEVTWTPNGSGGGTLDYTFAGQHRAYTVNSIMATFNSTQVYWGFTGSTGELTSVQAAAITRLPVQGVVASKTVTNEAGENIDKGTTYPGDTITYTIRVTVASLLTTIGPVIIDDEISSHVEYMGGSVQVTTKAGNVYDVTPAFLGSVMRVNTNHIFTVVDDWLEISFPVRVRQNTGGEIVYDTASATGEGMTGSAQTNTTEVTVLPPPEKSVSNTSEAGRDGSPVKVGDQITYNISFVNFEATAATIVIVDPLPTGVDFISATNGGIHNSSTHTVTWTLTNVPSGASGTVSVVVRVNESAEVMVEDSATVQIGDNEPRLTNTTENPVIPPPEKRVSNASDAGIGGGAVSVGDQVSYEITYQNYEAATATVLITDMLPTGLDFISASNSGVYNGATHTVTWTLTGVPGGASGIVSVVTRVNQNAEIRIENDATVQVGNNNPQISNRVENPVITPPEKKVSDISQTGRDGEAVKVGDQITYDIAYTNYETTAVTVIITDTLPTGVDIVSTTSGGIYNSATRTVTWTLPNVPPGTGGTVSLVVQVNRSAEVLIENYATAQIGQNEPLFTNIVENPLLPEKEVSAASQAGVGGDAVKVGDEITYNIVYANYEETTATIYISDPLPIEVDFISATDGGAYDSDTHTVTWMLTDVPARTRSTVSVVVRVNLEALVDIENNAEVQVEDNVPQITNMVENPVLPQKSVSESSETGVGGEAVKIGDLITYDITYANYEETDATIVIVDRLPTGVDFVSATSGSVYDSFSHTVTWTMVNVPADTSGTVSVVVRVNEGAVVFIEDDATVQVGTNEPRITNTTENPVIIPPEKMVSDSSEEGRDGAIVVLGDQITYDITYANYEGAAATISITDRLPLGVDFVSATNGGTYNSAIHTVTWTLADVPSGTGGKVSVVARVNESALVRIENFATVQVGNNAPQITNRVENPVATPPEKKVSDSSDAGRDGSAMRLGDQITYDITYLNYEAEPATVIITDQLPIGVDFVLATNDGVYNTATHTVTWTFVNMPSGAGGTVSVVATVNESAEVIIENDATVQVGDNQPQITNRVENPVIPPPEKKVSDNSEAGKNGSAVVVGDRITYDIIYKNFEATAAVIVITDSLPSGVDFISATNGGIYNDLNHTVTWTFVDVPGGVSGTVSVVTVVNRYAERLVEDYAMVQVGDNEALITNIVENPVIPLPEKKVSDSSDAGKDGSAVRVGDQITYNIIYTNYEPTAAAITITDPLPAGVDFVSATNGGIYNSATHAVTWTFASVASGASGMVSLVVRVNQSASVMIENYASVQVGENQPQITNRVENPITTTPEKKVSDSSEAGKDGVAVTVGDRITYDITYKNYEATAATITITDALPTGVDFVSATNGGIYNGATRTVTWTFVSVPSGTRGLVSVVVRVNQSAVTMIEDYATVQVGNNVPQTTNKVENPVKPTPCPPCPPCPPKPCICPPRPCICAPKPCVCIPKSPFCHLKSYAYPSRQPFCSAKCVLDSQSVWNLRPKRH